MSQDTILDIQAVLSYLPHRYPMLLVDRIIEVSENRAVGIKNVTINEPFFQGHYPGIPIMPGVLIIEAMAQAGAVLLLSQDAYKGLVPLIGSIDKVKFKRPVRPGDQLRSEIDLLWIKRGFGFIKAYSSVDGEMAAQMEMTFKLVPDSKFVAP